MSMQIEAQPHAAEASPDHLDDDHLDDHLDDHDRGLRFDLSTLMARRNLLRMFAGAGATAVLAACGSSNSASTAATTASTSGSQTTIASTATTDASSPTTAATSPTNASTGAMTVDSSASASASGSATAPAGAAKQAVPEETAGPFPGDGSNGVDVLSESGIIRSDIRMSFGSSTTVAKGVNTTVKLTIVDAATGTVLPGAAVYIWHCNIDGGYSMYSDNVKNENYLRGVQAADSNGSVTFETIYPGCYSGRWPHMHYEVYPTASDATSASSKLATSQLALPAETSDVVYASTGYEQSVTNAKRVTLASDMVFGDDGGVREIPKVTGTVADGYVITFTVPVTT